MGIINAWKGLFESELPKPPLLLAPKRRNYAGANSSRLTFSWLAAGTSADTEIKSSNKKLRNRTRQVCRDNVYARQAQRSIVQNVVGTGVRIQSDVRKLRGGKLDTKVNDAIEKAWKEWCRYDSCSANGRDSLDDISRLIVKSLFESGEVFVRCIKKPFGRSSVPFGLELLESDQLDDDFSGPTTNKNNTWRMGIERDQFQRAIRYAFFKQHPGDTPFPIPQGTKQHMFLPADEVIHLFIADRPGQTRGVSWIASALQDLHHLAGFQEASVIRARAASSIQGFISSPEGELVGDDVYEDERVTDFTPGVWKYLAPGEQVHVPQMDAPNGEFEPFLRAMLRGLASGCGVSYESVSRDFSQTNYSSSRLSLIEDRDHYKTIQGFLRERFFQPIFDYWLELAVLSGNLELGSFEAEPERYKRVRWLFRGWAFVDPQKEIAAAKEAVRSGFKTQAEVVAEQGGDLEELMAARKREVEQADQLSLSFESNPAITAQDGIVKVEEKANSKNNGGT
tara:strand:- start:491 stop:2017 length:1527 start_codon:yes stop_codon:yes gene_type:complete